MKCTLASMVMVIVSTGCTTGYHIGLTLDPIQEGSRLDSSYSRNRFADYRSGMQHLQQIEEKPGIESSPKRAWSWFK